MYISVPKICVCVDSHQASRLVTSSKIVQFRCYYEEQRKLNIYGPDFNHKMSV